MGDLGDFSANVRGKYTELHEYAAKISESKIQTVSWHKSKFLENFCQKMPEISEMDLGAAY